MSMTATARNSQYFDYDMGLMVGKTRLLRDVRSFTDHGEVATQRAWCKKFVGKVLRD